MSSDEYTNTCTVSIIGFYNFLINIDMKRMHRHSLLFFQQKTLLHANKNNLIFFHNELLFLIFFYYTNVVSMKYMFQMEFVNELKV